MSKYKYVSQGLFDNLEKAKEYWTLKTNRNCSIRTTQRNNKIELFFKLLK